MLKSKNLFLLARMKDYFLDWKIIPKEDAIPASIDKAHDSVDRIIKLPKKHESKKT